MVVYEFTLPYPPSVNNYWRNIRTRTILSRQGRAYRDRVKQVIWAASQGKPIMLRTQLAVEIDICPPDHRRRDLDNVLKAMLDAMQHAGVYADDYQFRQITIKRGDVVHGGRAIVKIMEASNGDA